MKLFNSRAFAAIFVASLVSVLPLTALGTVSTSEAIARLNSATAHSSSPLPKCFGVFSQKPYQPTYYIKEIGAGGQTITMHDETIWVIANNSASTVASWSPNSPIVITPSRWYSSYEYYIVNVATKESATAKLSQGPFLKYSVLIQQLDWNQGYAFLSNGTTWTFTPDRRKSPWVVGQAVLIGENVGSWSNKHILININEDNYLPARFVQ